MRRTMPTATSMLRGVFGKGTSYLQHSNVTTVLLIRRPGSRAVPSPDLLPCFSAILTSTKFVWRVCRAVLVTGRSQYGCRLRQYRRYNDLLPGIGRGLASFSTDRSNVTLLGFHWLLTKETTLISPGTISCLVVQSHANRLTQIVEIRYTVRETIILPTDMMGLVAVP